MPVDFTIFYKQQREPVEGWCADLQWDVFISAFNTTQRVKQVFQQVGASQKYWLVHSEYGFTEHELPREPLVFAPAIALREDEFVQSFLSDHCEDLRGKSVCVDISGFMRPHLVFLLRALAARGLQQFDAIYSEPNQYVGRERTVFSGGQVTEVRPISGYEGLHEPVLASDTDLMIIGAGYEHHLMGLVAYAKTNAKKLELFGFPPLQPDFYQENRLNAFRAAEAVSPLNEGRPLFAPSNDPFVTASVLQQTVNEQRSRGSKNVYLCPLSSRPQALGFAIYYMYEASDSAVSMIYPFSQRYAQDAATGISRIWIYRVELP
jgi:hypothetical protein